MQSNNRREFFKKAFFYTSAGVLVQTFARYAHSAAAELKLIDITGKKRTDADNKESLGMAQGLGYVEDLKKALAEKKTTKTDRTAGAKTWKAAEQTCDTCMFYDYKKEGKPTCQLLPKVLVHAKGSCNSWQPKA